MEQDRAPGAAELSKYGGPRARDFI